MRIALLAGTASIHTIRWANGLSRAGVNVHLLTQHEDLESVVEGVEIHRFPYRGTAGYYLMVPGVRRVLRRISPDLLNAHYASGYGTTARLAGFHPYLLSVWGSDVYDVPRRSFLHRHLVRSNLLAADRIASTSHCMAERVRELVPEIGHIEITPFGVEMDKFGAASTARGAGQEQETIVIGTVKVMAEKYGIDTLLRAFARLVRNLDAETAQRMRLRLVGNGPQLPDLQRLARSLQIDDRVVFAGRVPHEQVATELEGFDVYAALSRLDSESFGVAVIEAGAARRPVVVSDAGGLPEVVIDGRTGLVVSRDDPEAAANAMMRLVQNPGIRESMGQEARRHVQANYSWDVCVERLLDLYRSMVKEARPGSR